MLTKDGVRGDVWSEVSNRSINMARSAIKDKLDSYLFSYTHRYVTGVGDRSVRGSVRDSVYAFIRDQESSTMFITDVKRSAMRSLCR